MANSRTATNCKTCGRPVIDDEQCLATSKCETVYLRTQLQQAQVELTNEKDHKRRILKQAQTYCEECKAEWDTTQNVWSVLEVLKVSLVAFENSLVKDLTAD